MKTIKKVKVNNELYKIGSENEIIYLESNNNNNPFIIDDTLKDGQIFYIPSNAYVKVIGTNTPINLSNYLNTDTFYYYATTQGEKVSESSYGYGEVFLNSIAFKHNTSYISTGCMICKSGIQTTAYKINTFLSTEFLNINKAQTIKGKQTFTTLPETSIAPTSDNQLVNKAYVDQAIADAIAKLQG